VVGDGEVGFTCSSESSEQWHFVVLAILESLATL